MIEVFKILNGIGKCEKDKLFTLQPMIRTRGHSQKLLKRQFRLDLRKQFYLFIYLFFSQRVINGWNSLSEKVISRGSINQFKSGLNNFWKDKATKLEPDCYSYPFAHANRYSLMKEDKNGPKNREIITGLGYNNTVIQ